MSCTFSAIAQSKKHYCSSINALIDELYRQFFPSHKKISVLDVGSGNGSRLFTLTKNWHCATITIIEYSALMIEQAQRHPWNIPVTYLQENFTLSDCPPHDLTLCLWNVLGHCTTPSDRYHAFKKLAACTTQDGLLIFDVNNRFNIKNYGVLNAGKNILRYLLGRCMRRETAPLFQAKYTSPEGITVQTPVHIFNIYELEHSLNEVGMVIEKLCYVDYASGSQKATPWTGQIFIAARHR